MQLPTTPPTAPSPNTLYLFFDDGYVGGVKNPASYYLTNYPQFGSRVGNPLLAVVKNHEDLVTFKNTLQNITTLLQVHPKQRKDYLYVNIVLFADSVNGKTPHIMGVSCGLLANIEENYPHSVIELAFEILRKELRNAHRVEIDEKSKKIVTL